MNILNLRGESARKIHAVDWCMTRSREPGNLNGLGVSKIVKSRRGEEQVVDYNIRLSNGRFKSLPKPVYDDIKQINEKRHFTEAELDMMINNYLAARNSIQQQLNQLNQQRTGNGGGRGSQFAGPSPF